MGLADSLQPTLQWEAFPRPEDLKADKAGRLAAARDPTYELRIWRDENNFPAELVYARSGLPEPIHTVEIPLAPDTRYLWTIRARFELNGEPRVTEWGHWENDGRAVSLHYPVFSRQHPLEISATALVALISLHYPVYRQHLPSGSYWFRIPSQ